MKNYFKANLIMLIAIIIVLVLIAIDLNKGNNNENNLNGETQKEIVLIYETPKVISKALSLKMVALSKEDIDTIKHKDAEIELEGITQDDWFYKYFNMAIIEGYYNDDKDIKPLDPLNYQEAGLICKHFNIDLEKLGIDYKGKETETISYEEWILIYNEIIKSDDAKQPVEISLYIFASPALSSELSKWEVATDRGKYSFEGIVIDGLINKEIVAYVRENEILYIKGIKDEKPILTNAYIIDLNKDTYIAEVFMGGVSRNVPIDKELSIASKKGFIADIKISENEIIELVEKNKTTKGIISKITSKEVEIEGIGRLALSEDIKFYDVIEKPRFTNYSSIIVGYDTAVFVLDEKDENQVVAAIIREKISINNIRVLINDTGLKQPVHKNVLITSSSTYKMSIKGQVETKKANEVADLEKIALNIGDRLIFTPEEGKKIKINSIKRGSGDGFNPEYRGIIEIEKVDGGYIIINEVDFEEYLYAVVPSEMPTSYGLEAAKVQAVCARSYAFNQIHGNRFCNYGAHVDDSTSSQVYNNTQETEISIKGVNETKGQLLSYQGSIISSNFFSTSCGITSDQGDVWANYLTKEFPTDSSPYLVSKYQSNDEIDTLDYSEEENFKKFILDKKAPSFDLNFPFYRWSTKMSAKQIEASINKSIGARYKVQPKLIKTLDENDIFRSREVNDIGELLDIWIHSRGKSGIITEVVVQGTKGVYKIATEYNIRALIAPINYVEGKESVVITKNDGSTTKDMSLMPSAFYIIDKKFDSNNRLTEVIFHGGGYGHGVGMSQNGAKAMVDLGYTYEEILKHYYQGTELINIM